MSILGIVVLLAGYVFWMWMLASVHRRTEESPSRASLMTVTFYSLGLAGPVILLGGKHNAPRAHGRWQRALSRLLARYVKPKVQPPAPTGDHIAITLIGHDGQPSLTEGLPQGEGDPLTAVRMILQKAIREGATDIHLEPEPNEFRVRCRIDGVLQARQTYPVEMASSVVSALKVLAGEDVSEKRRPQDGSLSAFIDGRSIDIRCSTAGTSHGEKMVLRVLDKGTHLLRLESLGLRKDALAQIRSIVESAHGMLIVCGPTGSGKTTTLYAALQEVDTMAKNVITIEDPIEYNLENVNQLNINVKAGITFPSLLRTTLRQDPDIIMVGEIRDKDTAQIALQAALTGHFVYSTVHANDTISSVFRLYDLGVEPYLIASALTGLLAQRLMRKLCPNCREPYKPPPEVLKQHGIPAERVETLYRPRGCDNCLNSGYKGRIGVFELLRLDDELRGLIQSSPSIPDMKKAGRAAGLVTLREDALSKVCTGITSLEEAVKIVA